MWLHLNFNYCSSLFLLGFFVRLFDVVVFNYFLLYFHPVTFSRSDLIAGKQT